MAQADYSLTMNNGLTTLVLTPYVASITPSYQRRNTKTITAIDGTEYSFQHTRKHHLKVAFKPMTGNQLKALYDFLTAVPRLVWYTVTYKCPTMGGASLNPAPKMRIANEFETKFLLRSVDNNQYYAGFTLELREQ